MNSGVVAGEGLRLRDVVKQRRVPEHFVLRGQSNDLERVVQEILHVVAVRLREMEAQQLRQDVLREPEIDGEAKSLVWVGGEENAVDLVSDALPGYPSDLRGGPGDSD